MNYISPFDKVLNVVLKAGYLIIDYIISQLYKTSVVLLRTLGHGHSLVF